MKAVYVKEFGDVENLEIHYVEKPIITKEKQVLIRVKAAGLNRADILQRKGFYPAPKGYPERVLGLEFAGVVVETGSMVSKVEIGNRVFGITSGGGQAEFVLVREDQVVKIPENLNFEEAAAIPEVFITAHDAVFTQGNLAKNETLLIHAVGSGVGLAALQIAKAAGNKVIGTSRSQDKLDRCFSLGLDTGINTIDSRDFSCQLKNSVDVVLDLVGAKYFEKNVKSLAFKGRLILVGLVGGKIAEFNMGLALAKRLHIIGTNLRSRTLDEKAKAISNFAKNVLPLIEEGKITPNLDKVFELEEIKEAHTYMEKNSNFGKIVVYFN